MKWIRSIRAAGGALAAALLSLGAAEATETVKWNQADPAREASAGAQVYRANCAACHEAGVGRAPQKYNLADMTPEAIHYALTKGPMQPQGSALSDEQKIQVAEYLSGRKFGAAVAETALNKCTGAAAKFDLNEPPAFSGWGLDPASTHAIPAATSGLDKANVGHLRLKWAFGVPNSTRMRSLPAVAGGAILVGNYNGSVYALDRATGCVRWAFPASAEIRTGILVSPWRAGDTRAKPLVYFGDVSGNVYAVDLLTGTQAWKIRANDHPATIITGTPTLWRGTLYVPISSNEEAFATQPGYNCCSFRGSIVALDGATGREKWRTWLVGEPVKHGTTRDGSDWLGPSGVAVWNSPLIDARRGQLIFATGDNYSLPDTDLSDSIMALDLNTGRIKWHYQALAGDAWNVACVVKTSASCPDEQAPDFDFGAGTTLARGKNGREYVLAGQKSGWVYAVDPATGRLAWKTRVGRGSPSGGVHFGMAADGGLVFVPITDNFKFGPPDFPASPGVYALDIATGAFVWKQPSPVTGCETMLCHPGYGGALAVTGGMVLAGADDGHVRVFDGATGKLLWDEPTAHDYTTINGVPAHGGAISGGVGPIAYKGTLIVASGYGFASKPNGNVLLVYGVE
jgi:polyvinyl alcohol dehydrogenase (cytochrome)